MKNTPTTLFILMYAYAGVFAQFNAGQSYFSPDNHIEYIAGNLPIVLTAPHGGYLEPASIPDRNCNGCSYVRDAYTQELTKELQSAIYSRTGCYPHVIINLLHRKKLDANRDLAEAADGDPLGAIAWQNYHDFVDSAKAEITATFGKGLYFDMHGHAHTIQRLELGYLISKNNLQQSDSVINHLANSSINNLVATNLNAYSKADLIRGTYSLGTLCEHKGYPAVPSSNQPFPASSDPYFSGGYNTDRHGSKSGGVIDAIQIECNSNVRFNTSDRLDFADSLAAVILEYADKHYFSTTAASTCITTAVQTHRSEATKIFPNPTNEYLNIYVPEPSMQVFIYNVFAQCIYKNTLSRGQNKINLSNLEAGVYYLQLKQYSTKSLTYKIIKE